MDYLVEHFDESMQCNYSTYFREDILHLHNLLELLFVLEGDVCFFADGKSFLLERGNLLFINNDLVHGIKQLSDKVYRRLTIHFSATFAKDLSTNQTDLLAIFKSRNLITKLDESQIPIMEKLMIDLTKEYSNPSLFGHDLLASTLLTQILVSANIFANERQSEFTDYPLPELVRNTMDFIHEHLCDSELSLKEIANHLYHNDIYLNRIFKKELGITIHQYILLNRISMAKKLLHKGYDVQSCCNLCGFNDYSNFIRAFKKITNYSPKQYSLINNEVSTPNLIVPLVEKDQLKKIQ